MPQVKTSIHDFAVSLEPQQGPAWPPEYDRRISSREARRDSAAARIMLTVVIM
ncbi:MAG TPA: hypothetical protein VGU21_06035 [Streptosporangiaceae bacterium]|nr:hypothetical protein [Streptosporangiaceae bacterium]